MASTADGVQQRSRAVGTLRRRPGLTDLLLCAITYRWHDVAQVSLKAAPADTRSPGDV